MNDIRRTILWVIFGFSMVLLWDQWQVHNGKSATFFPSGKPAATAPAPAGASSVPSPSATPAATPAAKASAVPGSSAPPGPAAAPAAAGEKITVETDLLRLTFNTEGGSLVRTEFLTQAGENKTGTFVLLDDSVGRKYVAESGLIGGDFPNHKTVMAFSGDRELKAGANSLVLKFESPEKNGVKLVKTY